MSRPKEVEGQHADERKTPPFKAKALVRFETDDTAELNACELDRIYIQKD